MVEVVVVPGDGQQIVFVITTASIQPLKLPDGQRVTFVIKSIKVTLATEE